MSKSKGEFLTVSLLEEKGYDPLVYRLFCLQSHYRNVLVFSYENLDNAKAAYDKLIARIAALDPRAEGEIDEAAMAELKGKFTKAMDNDLATALAVTAVYDVLKYKTNDRTKLAAIESFDTVLGLDLLKKAEEKRRADAKAAEEAKKKAAAGSDYVIQGEGDAEIDALVAARGEAKKNKNFAEADRIREELRQKGIEVTDVRGGAVWKRV
jgi:cysteinyl-tRNA synthetase